MNLILLGSRTSVNRELLLPILNTEQLERHSLLQGLLLDPFHLVDREDANNPISIANKNSKRAKFPVTRVFNLIINATISSAIVAIRLCI
jgi:hypothetical protein